MNIVALNGNRGYQFLSYKAMNQNIVFLTQITGRFTNKTAQANFKYIDLILNFLKTMNSRQHIKQGMEALKDVVVGRSGLIQHFGNSAEGVLGCIMVNKIPGC